MLRLWRLNLREMFMITVCENLKAGSDVTLKTAALGLYWKLVNFKYFEVRSFTKPFPDQRSQEDNATFLHFPLQPVLSIA